MAVDLYDKSTLNIVILISTTKEKVLLKIHFFVFNDRCAVLLLLLFFLHRQLHTHINAQDRQQLRNVHLHDAGDKEWQAVCKGKELPHVA